MHWILKRQDNNDTLQLHAQFVWSDEFDWTALAQSDPVYTLTGAMVVQQGTKKAGRPITLNGNDTRTTRADLAVLQAWAAVPELEMTLTHPQGQSHRVIFDRPFMDNIKAIKQYRPADEDGEDKYTVHLHFLTI